jgi:transcriptional regulator with XRE-family HTH domain
MPAHLTQDEVVARLHSIIRTRTQSSLADEIGVSRSFLCEIMRGTRPPTGKILDHLGLKAQTVYIKKGQNQ